MAKAASGGGADIAAELKNTIKVLRRRKMYFAIGMNGKTPIIKTDIKKKPKTLRRLTKGEGAGAKGCSGEIGINGKVLELYCIEDQVPDTIAKQTTKFLRENGLQFRVEIMPETIDEPAEEEEPEAAEEEAAARPRRADDDAQSGDVAPSGRGAAEAAAEELREAGVETSGAADTGAADAGAADTGAARSGGEAPQKEAPAGRTTEQEQLLKGLRDMKAMLQQVSQSGRKEDVARMQKFGDLFKKAVKQNDARVGQKVLDGMRQLAKQVEANAKETQKRRKTRLGRLQKMRAGLQSLIRELG